MSEFQESEVIWYADRSFKDRKEALVLERGQFNGSATYSLRILWLTRDGQWRWSQAKPTSSGKTWASLNIKARELASLGLALTAEAANPLPVINLAAQLGGADAQKRQPSAAPSSASAAATGDAIAADDDDLPF